MTDDHPPPTWACKRWGDYEHDWMSCPDCVAGYEKARDEELRQEEIRYWEGRDDLARD